MKERRFDFGWSRAAYAGPWIFAAVLIGAALGLQLARPDLWSAWFAVALVAVNSFVGGLVLRASTGRTTRRCHSSICSAPMTTSCSTQGAAPAGPRCQSRKCALARRRTRYPMAARSHR